MGSANEPAAIATPLMKSRREISRSMPSTRSLSLKSPSPEKLSDVHHPAAPAPAQPAGPNPSSDEVPLADSG
jgi:hypothetical protein